VTSTLGSPSSVVRTRISKACWFARRLFVHRVARRLYTHVVASPFAVLIFCRWRRTFCGAYNPSSIVSTRGISSAFRSSRREEFDAETCITRGHLGACADHGEDGGGGRKWQAGGMKRRATDTLGNRHGRALTVREADCHKTSPLKACLSLCLAFALPHTHYTPHLTLPHCTCTPLYTHRRRRKSANNEKRILAENGNILQ